tara:strand:- start:491 stop:991 length:501 start_codon:yes stop_codon:yes gene_type:complete
MFLDRQAFLKSSVKYVVAVGIFVLIIPIIWLYKPTLLGIDIFFVPSNSMAPTLLPGQFILVDSWRYQRQSPQVGDVVVVPFQINGQSSYLVKRLAEWPTGVYRPPETPWYLLGDNPAESHDSRYFGGVAELYAPVTHILFRWNGQRIECPCFMALPVNRSPDSRSP